jgi:hypothetical protein
MHRTQTKLDKYARDFGLWRDWATINYQAAKKLFESGDPFRFFQAATLGHHALEMYPKSALNCIGQLRHKSRHKRNFGGI